MLQSQQKKIQQLEKQVELYETLLALTKKENKLLKEGQKGKLNKVKEQKRDVRDEIEKIELKFNISKGDKLKLMNKSSSEKLAKIKPLVKEIYRLEKESQRLTAN